MKRDIYVNNNTKRLVHSLRNVIVGLTFALISTVIPFFLRMVLAYKLGDAYLGLNSLFGSIINILSVTEMGLGSVMVYFLYAPVAENQKEKIAAYLNELKYLYHLVGKLIFVIGMIVALFLRKLISGNIPPDANIQLLFFIYLIATVAQYFLFPEYLILFNAFQRNDISSRVSLYSNLVTYIVQFAALICFSNYYCYLIGLVIQAGITGGLRRYYKKRYFADYKVVGRLSTAERKEIKKSMLSMVGHQIDEKLLNSIDNLFISILLGLTAVGVYSNYFFVITAISLMFKICHNAMLASIGNALVTETKRTNYELFRSLFWLNTVITGLISACLLCLYQSLMTIWMGHTRLFDDKMIVLFVIYLYVSQLRMTVVSFKNAAGMWWNDRYKPYFSVALDILLDLILISAFGVEGAIIASIICVALIEMPWETIVLFKDLFHTSVRDYMLYFLKLTIINAAIGGSMFTVSMAIEGENSFIVAAERLIVCVVGAGIYYLIFSKSKEYSRWIDRVNMLLGSTVE